MKLKKVKLIIESYEEMTRRAVQAVKTGIPDIQKPNEVFFTSWESLGRVLTSNRLQLFELIYKHEPASIYALAKLAKRDFKNVHSDVHMLATLGFIELKKTKSKRASLKPVALCCGFEVDLAA